MAFAFVLFIEERDGEDLGDASVGIAVLVVLDSIAWSAGLQYQRRLMLKDLYNPAADTLEHDFETDEFAQLFHAVGGHSDSPVLPLRYSLNSLGCNVEIQASGKAIVVFREECKRSV